MNARPALNLIAITMLAAGSIVGCGPTEEDSPSSVAFDTQAPTVPSGITAVHLQDGSTLLSWRANRTDPDLAGYVVYRSTQVESGYRLALDEPVRSNSWIDENVSTDGPVWYRIAARDANANESPLSPAVSAGRHGTLPAAASVITAAR